MVLGQVTGCPFNNPQDCPFYKKEAVWHDIGVSSSTLMVPLSGVTCCAIGRCAFNYLCSRPTCEGSTK